MDWRSSQWATSSLWLTGVASNEQHPLYDGQKWQPMDNILSVMDGKSCHWTTSSLWWTEKAANGLCPLCDGQEWQPMDYVLSVMEGKSSQWTTSPFALTCVCVADCWFSWGFHRRFESFIISVFIAHFYSLPYLFIFYFIFLLFIFYCFCTIIVVHIQ